MKTIQRVILMVLALGLLCPACGGGEDECDPDVQTFWCEGGTLMYCSDFTTTGRVVESPCESGQCEEHQLLDGSWTATCR
ncbi:MAG TPA: hypothetical protein PK668_21670 [Myxococcota bacterium]|nr:hypothetical protein [Myxococcota bacterium]HRY96088.1 hypothetical protein [Myxococcota bacterium]HSA21601.1 hypothetical protein [Myxococcota bacterium]